MFPGTEARERERVIECTDLLTPREGTACDGFDPGAGLCGVSLAGGNSHLPLPQPPPDPSCSQLPSVALSPPEPRLPSPGLQRHLVFTWEHSLQRKSEVGCFCAGGTAY